MIIDAGELMIFRRYVYGSEITQVGRANRFIFWEDEIRDFMLQGVDTEGKPIYRPNADYNSESFLDHLLALEAITIIQSSRIPLDAPKGGMPFWAITALQHPSLPRTYALLVR